MFSYLYVISFCFYSQHLKWLYLFLVFICNFTFYCWFWIHCSYCISIFIKLCFIFCQFEKKFFVFPLFSLIFQCVWCFLSLFIVQILAFLLCNFLWFYCAIFRSFVVHFLYYTFFVTILYICSIPKYPKIG